MISLVEQRWAASSMSVPMGNMDLGNSSIISFRGRCWRPFGLNCAIAGHREKMDQIQLSYTGSSVRPSLPLPLKRASGDDGSYSPVIASLASGRAKQSRTVDAQSGLPRRSAPRNDWLGASSPPAAVGPDLIRARCRQHTNAASTRWLPRIRSGATTGDTAKATKQPSLYCCIKFTPHSKTALKPAGGR